MVSAVSRVTVNDLGAAHGLMKLSRIVEKAAKKKCLKAVQIHLPHYIPRKPGQDHIPVLLPGLLLRCPDVVPSWRDHTLPQLREAYEEGGCCGWRSANIYSAAAKNGLRAGRTISAGQMPAQSAGVRIPTRTTCSGGKRRWGRDAGGYFG